MNDAAFQKCINPACGQTFSVEQALVACTSCGSLLDIIYDWSRLPVPKSLNYFEHRWSTKGTATEGRIDFSGVWRFRELFPFYRTEDDIVSITSSASAKAELRCRPPTFWPGKWA